MPTFHLFMLEVKCFTFHWRRQMTEMYLALFRGNFIFINIFLLSSMNLTQ
uniref:Uncharacterized protein n=1 Tax=Saimiri boliviensis boliviensis TaxID=39432 RepID=A0A2K6S5H9_SAIBB